MKPRASTTWSTNHHIQYSYIYRAAVKRITLRGNALGAVKTINFIIFFVKSTLKLKPQKAYTIANVRSCVSHANNKTYAISKMIDSSRAFKVSSFFSMRAYTRVVTARTPSGKKGMIFCDLMHTTRRRSVHTTYIHARPSIFSRVLRFFEAFFVLIS